MSTFYPQLTSDESLVTQWNRYLRQKPLILNIEEIVHDQTSEHKQMLNETSASIRQDLNKSTAAVCDTIESGFEILSEHLREISYDISDIRYEINAMSSILHWGFTQTIEQHRISNLLLGNISLLLRIPDFQKERYNYIEKGIKFLKNSFFDPEMFEDALKYLLKAEELEPEDYFTLYRIGLIYLNSPNCDIIKAEIYFKKSAKYAIVETNEGATISNNILMLDINSKFEDQLKESDKIKIEAAESYVLAARCCFLQNNFGDAAELAHKAFQIVPNMVEAGFLEAQALSANNEISKSVEVLRTVIDRDRFYSFKTTRHIDLISKIEIKNLIEELRNAAHQKASNLLRICKSNMIDGSVVQCEIEKIQYLINKGSYLHSMKALDLLNMERSYSHAYISLNNKNLYYNPHAPFNEINEYFDKLIKQQNIYEYHWHYRFNLISIVQNFVLRVNSIFSYLNENTQWDFNPITDRINPYNNESYIFNKILKIEVTSKLHTSDLFNFIITEKKYYENLNEIKYETKKMFDILSNCYEEIQKDKNEIKNKRERVNYINSMIGTLKLGLFGFGPFFGIILSLTGKGFVLGYVFGIIFSFIFRELIKRS